MSKAAKVSGDIEGPSRSPGGGSAVPGPTALVNCMGARGSKRLPHCDAGDCVMWRHQPPWPKPESCPTPPFSYRSSDMQCPDYSCSGEANWLQMLWIDSMLTAEHKPEWAKLDPGLDHVTHIKREGTGPKKSQ